MKPFDAVNDLHLLHHLLWFDSCIRPDREFETPLSCFFLAAQRNYSWKGLQRDLCLLLDALASHGVDLAEYGRCEFEIWGREHGAVHLETGHYVRIDHWHWKLHHGPALMWAT